MEDPDFLYREPWLILDAVQRVRTIGEESDEPYLNAAASLQMSSRAMAMENAPTKAKQGASPLQHFLL